MSRDALLARLARLDAQDRAWLLGELPPDMRRDLAAGLNEDAPATPPSPAMPQGWESLDAGRVADVLEPEPAWLVSAATRGTEAVWRERLLQHMPPRRRHEIEHADRSWRALNPRAGQWVLAACRERIASGAIPARTSPPRGGFAALVDQMKSRFA